MLKWKWTSWFSLAFAGLVAVSPVAYSSKYVSSSNNICLPADLDGSLSKQSKNDIRFATFNAFLNRNSEGELVTELQSQESAQVQAVAEIIQRTQPDILLLNEFDYDASGEAITLFQENYLGVSQNGQSPIEYPYVYLAESNTGIPSGFDLDNDNSVSGPGDAFGFGFFPGQFGMVLLSQYPIMEHRVRTFQKFLWKDMPNALIPEAYYTQEELDHFRLSSKSHWDIPVRIRGQVVHVLAAHPTPPVFDGPEDRNGRRNHDEIRFWADYVGHPSNSRYIYDDSGRRGGLSRRRAFVILGDYNADPEDGDSTNSDDSTNGAISQLLHHRAIDASTVPGSLGASEDAELEAQVNDIHIANAAMDTADFNPAGPGNLRVDYVLPSHRQLKPKCGGVFWPQEKDETRYLVGPGFPVVSSDHHLVWYDMAISKRYFYRY